MKKKKFLYKKKEQIRWFNRISTREFAEWIRNFLEHGWTGCIVLDAGGSDRDVFLKEYFFSIDNDQFRDNFRKAVFEILEWLISLDKKSRYSEDNISLLNEVLLLIGWTNNTYCFEMLLDMAQKESLKNILYENVNMHERLLSVLFGLKMNNGIRDSFKKDMKHIIEEDIEDDRFTQLCFRKNWEISNNIADSIKYLPRLFECRENVPLTHFTLSRFVEGIGIRNFVKHLEQIWEELGDLENKVSFLDYMPSVGIGWYQYEDEIVLIHNGNEYRVRMKNAKTMFEIMDMEVRTSISSESSIKCQIDLSLKEMRVGPPIIQPSLQNGMIP